MFRNAAPDGIGLPGAVHHGLHAARVVLVPGLHDAPEEHRRRNALHRCVVGNHGDLQILACGGNCGRVGVVREHVGLLSDQGLRGVGFLARVVPGGGPDHANLNIGVHALGAERVGIDALKDFRNRHRSDVS